MSRGSKRGRWSTMVEESVKRLRSQALGAELVGLFRGELGRVDVLRAMLGGSAGPVEASGSPPVAEAGEPAAAGGTDDLRRVARIEGLASGPLDLVSVLEGIAVGMVMEVGASDARKLVEQHAADRRAGTAKQAKPLAVPAPPSATPVSRDYDDGDDEGEGPLSGMRRIVT